MRAWIRDLYGDDRPTGWHALDPIDGVTPFVVAVPVFGLLVFADRGHGWESLMSTGDEALDLAHRLPREMPVRAVDDHLEVEMLPNVSGEDRIVVCFEP